MRNINYAELRDDIIDRLDNAVLGQGAGGEILRQKKQSPSVIARAASAAIIEFCRQISHVSVPDLVQTVYLQSEGITFDDLYGFSFPSDAMHEREDGGVISFIMNGEQVDFGSSIPYEQLVAKSRLKMYTGKENLFSIDLNKRRIYTAKVTNPKVRIFKRPHSVYSAAQNMRHGVRVSGATSSLVIIKDGIGGSVTSSIGGASNIVEAVNNSLTFAYNAEFVNGSLTFFIRPDVSTDIKLNPSISSGSFTLTDIGTYKIPIPHHFIDTIASTSFAILLESARQLDRSLSGGRQSNEKESE